MKFKEVKRVSVTDEIIEQFKKMVLDGTLKPGERLPTETTIASQMGVGRGAVREAFQVLIYLGVVERINKKSYVSPGVMDRIYPKDIFKSFAKHRDIMHIIEVRRIIEPESAGLAALRYEQGQIEELETQHRLMIENKQDLEKFITYNNKFHLAIIQATENKILIDIMKGIQVVMRRNQALVLRNSSKIHPRSIEYHKRILDAIKEAQCDDAREHMLNHILDIEREMYVLLQGENE
ncbi:MAG: FadR family transcriptional regulator [Spirochaetes bacterium]|nr:FadR family transcriptional regulator [Spirochaetota bacterium]